MSAIVTLALVLWAGSSPWPLLLTVAAVRYPGPGLVSIGVWILWGRLTRRRGPSPDDEAHFLEAVVTELNGGASPRSAVVRATERQEVVDARVAARAAHLGLDSARLASAFVAALPVNGRLAGAAWAISTDSGASFGPVMQVLVHRAAERGRLLRERRALTAQARATAWLVAGVPMGLFVVLAAAGRIDFGPSLPIAVMGLGLQVLGVAIVIVMLRSRS